MSAISTKGLALPGFLCVSLCAAVAEVSLAVTVPVTFDLWPSHGKANVLEITAAAEIDYFAGVLDTGDSSSADMSGHVTADLEIHLDPATPHIVDILAITLTGGNIRFEDVAMELDFSPFGSIQADLISVAATPGTPVPPVGVHGDTFDAGEHALTANMGSVNLSGTGLIGQLYMDPISTDLSSEPVDLGPAGTGVLEAALLRVDGDQATYEVILTLPVDWDVVTYDRNGARLSVEGVGTVGAAGRFVQMIPEPATMALLAFGALVLPRRRRTNAALRQ
ncbi:MAG: PEP-CTERM sorting domain-containing protein [Phycisphaerales bacterium]|nr:MAG: PEP-CTERM sorting domain-containing protein [Phycisphaerales bacterium]